MVRLIIPAAVRKEYKRCITCRILTCVEQLLYVYRRDVMTQGHARISRNQPGPLTLENIVIR